MNRKYSWKPDLPDHRDRIYRATDLTIALPPVVDLRPKCPEVFDQGSLGSCTGNALAGALGFVHKNYQDDPQTFSRLFIYYNERLIEHTVKEDAGAQIRDGIKSLVKAGACSEETWPYDISKFTRKPPKAAYREALKNTISSYERIGSLDSMLRCLAAGWPFVFGFMVYESFESKAVAEGGVMPMPGLNERDLGGHAVTAVGYNMETRHIIVRNSWGADWGQGGYFMMPFDYISNPQLADDFWMIRK